ncbi:MAG: MFS transporter [Planctomycetes bacterium]|nr:MFS transporter [Planctomycetota bacterium]
MGRSESSSLLRNRNFILLWFAYFVSAIGDHLSEMAILSTQGALGEDVDIAPLMARMLFVFFVPFLLFGPMMGWLADRFPRRRIMIGADIARMILMCGFAWLIAKLAPLSPTWGPYLPLLLIGIFAAMFSPARSALLPTLIRNDQLVEANALIRGVGIVATAISAALGGWLADHHALLAFEIDAGTFAVSAVLVFMIVVPPADRRVEVSRAKFLPQVLAGVRYVSCHRRVGQLVVIGTIYWFSAAVVNSVLPAIVKGAYGQSTFTEIQFFRIFLVVGMVLGAGALFILKDALRSETAITWCLNGAGMGGVLLALSTLSWWPNTVAYAIGVVAIVIVGFFGSALIASYNALLQRIVPDRFRGRVYGVLDVCTMSGLLLACGLLGIPQWPHLDQWCGAIAAVVGILLMTAGMASLVFRYRSQLDSMPLAMTRTFNELWCRFWYHHRCIGACTIPREGPVIVTSNHTAPPDPLMIYASCSFRRISFMTAREYMDFPVFKWFVRMVECIPVNRDGQDTAATREAMRRLKNGDALGIFIEGGIPDPGEVKEPKNGVALLALRTGAPVVPIHIAGNVFREGIAAGFFARHRAEVRYGNPVDLSEFSKKPTREELDAATKKIHNAILALAPDADTHK